MPSYPPPLPLSFYRVWMSWQSGMGSVHQRPSTRKASSSPPKSRRSLERSEHHHPTHVELLCRTDASPPLLSLHTTLLHRPSRSLVHICRRRSRGLPHTRNRSTQPKNGNQKSIALPSSLPNPSPLSRLKMHHRDAVEYAECMCTSSLLNCAPVVY